MTKAVRWQLLKHSVVVQRGLWATFIYGQNHNFFTLFETAVVTGR
jgi:hypothetical protein